MMMPMMMMIKNALIIAADDGGLDVGVVVGAQQHMVALAYHVCVCRFTRHAEVRDCEKYCSASVLFCFIIMQRSSLECVRSFNAHDGCMGKCMHFIWWEQGMNNNTLALFDLEAVLVEPEVRGDTVVTVLHDDHHPVLTVVLLKSQ